MSRKKIKLYTPRDDLSEYENFEELATRLIRVDKKQLENSSKELEKVPAKGKSTKTLKNP